MKNIYVLNKHIYISSDEEIKNYDYCIDDIGEVFKIDNLEYFKKFCKKIILTTDQDLIKDGVQEIDDEFLEWFVQNPSCKYIETHSINFIDKEIGIIKNHRYKIIIPKEEPKQETLEEYIERETKGLIEPNLKAAAKAFLSYGAKWQQERMYSEEDMIEASKYGYNFHKTTQFQNQEFEDSCIRNTQQWLTKFKKK